ncbi:MAG: hypothetical protein RDV41_06990, partial [Planctomycetota bacterium]|nr:hypothetical protein [Planctomycetota bacterium]
VIRHEMVFIEKEEWSEAKKKIKQIWYSPKKARGRIKKSQLLEKAQEDMNERVKQRAAIFGTVSVHSGPFDVIPTEFPEATREVIEEGR